MTIKSGDSVYTNYNNLSSISTLYFHNNTSPDGDSIKLDTATNDFTISNNLFIEGELTLNTKLDPVYIDQSGAADEEALTWDSDTSRWSPVETPSADTGTKEYAGFYLNSSSGITGIGGTARQVNVAATSVNSNGSVFSLSSNQVTVNKTGVFLITAEVVATSNSTTDDPARSEYITWIEKNSTEITGSKCRLYIRGYSCGTTGSSAIIENVTSGDVFRIMIVRTAGSESVAYQDSWGTKFSFKEL